MKSITQAVDHIRIFFWDVDTELSKGIVALFYKIELHVHSVTKHSYHEHKMYNSTNKEDALLEVI